MRNMPPRHGFKSKKCEMKPLSNISIVTPFITYILFTSIQFNSTAAFSRDLESQLPVAPQTL
jgi:hypothetical protein